MMYQSNWSFNIPPPGKPRAFELLKIGLFKFPPLGEKSRSNAPPIVTEIPLLKDKFRLQSNTVHACQREVCRNDAFKFHLKTVLSALFTNKGEILPWKSVKPCKNRKTHGHITLELEINLVQISHPSKATFKFPPFRARCTVKCPVFAWGDVEASIWPVHKWPVAKGDNKGIWWKTKLLANHTTRAVIFQKKNAMTTFTVGFSFLKPGAYVDRGWAEQNGGSKKHWQNSKASSFVFIFFLFAFRTTDELTVWICLSQLNWCNTDNVQYRVDSWQFVISPRAPRLRIGYG